RRKGLLTGSGDRRVTPNHVLVPAANVDECPWGPPSPATDGTLAQPVGEAREDIWVTVIDSGYNRWTWPDHDPLGDLLGQRAENRAEHHIRATHAPGSMTSNPTFAYLSSLTGAPGWAPDPWDVPRARKTGVLDALAGHANF